MWHVDIPTMIAMIVVVSLAMGAAVVFVSWGEHRQELWIWAAAVFLHGLVFVLYALRGAVPDLLSVVAANALLASVFSLMLFAVGRFRRQEVGAARLVAPVVVTAIGCAVLLHWQAARSAFTGVVFAGQLFLLAAAILRGTHFRAGRGRYLAGISAAAMGLVFVLRALASATGQVDMSTFTSPNFVQTLTFMTDFLAVVLASVGFIFMAKERADERNQLLASHDELTATLNRRFVLQQLERHLSQARRLREPLTLLMVDLDFFKRVNDTHGHLAGDEVLRRVGEAIRSRVRLHDLVGRYGGEEFLVILPGTGEEGGRQLAESLREGVCNARIAVHDREIPVSVSIGVHGGVPAAEDSVDSLIEAADRALYRAKELGRNRVESL